MVACNGFITDPYHCSRKLFDAASQIKVRSPVSTTAAAGGAPSAVCGALLARFPSALFVYSPCRRGPRRALAGVTAVSAQSNAATHPTTVQPSRRLRAKNRAPVMSDRAIATIVGRNSRRRNSSTVPPPSFIAIPLRRRPSGRKNDRTSMPPSVLR